MSICMFFPFGGTIGRYKCLTLFFLISTFFSIHKQSQGQVVQPYWNKNVIKAGYGLSVAGTRDIPGQQIMLGIQNQFRRHHLYEVRVGGTLIQRNKTWGQLYSVPEKSNGISVEADYGFTLQWWRLTFYPTIGPVVRYSHEVYPIYIGVWYDQNGNITRFEAPTYNEHVWKVGGTGGINFDFKLNYALSLGLRASVQVYQGGHTLTFYGLTLKNTKWSF